MRKRLIHVGKGAMMALLKGGMPMKVEIQLDESAAEKRVIILTDKMDAEVQELIKRLSVQGPQVLAGFREDRVRLLDQTEIFRIFASSGKVFAVTGEGTYTLRLRLYELEERLDRARFVRISNSEIVNLRKVKGFDMSYTGTIRVSLTNGDTTFVSRRYVGRIKGVLGL